MTIQQLKFDNRVHLPAAGITIALTLFFPFMVHLIGGPTAGTHWLPLFYAPLVAAILFNPYVTIVAGLITPFLNHFLTGAPPLPMAVLLSFELIVFAVVVQQIYRFWPNLSTTAPFAYIVAKIAELLLLLILPVSLMPTPPWQFFTNSVSNAWVGLVVLLLINWLTVKGVQGDR